MSPWSIMGLLAFQCTESIYTPYRNGPTPRVFHPNPPYHSGSAPEAGVLPFVKFLTTLCLIPGIDKESSLTSPASLWVCLSGILMQ